VFEVIRAVKPSKLFIAADGPRHDKLGEEEKCTEVRHIIDDGIDWKCEVQRLYREKNLGCKVAPASAISWFFQNVEEGIVLEDDCLPHPTFFPFCEELLKKYRDDKRVMIISGFNHVEKWKSDIQSYHFSYQGDIWGWASWRRAWDYYDIDMKLWGEPEVKTKIRDILCDKGQYLWLKQSFDIVYTGVLNSAWDYQWAFARLLYSGFSIIPSVNLISNIGYHGEATHTVDPAGNLANYPTYRMSFPLKEPYGLVDDREYNRMYYLIKSGNLDNMARLNPRISRGFKRHKRQMKSLIEESVKKLFNFMGFNVTRIKEEMPGEGRKFAPSQEDKFKWLQNMNVKTVIDVGAHTGESALHLHEIFPNAKIYSFEPLYDCFMQLNDKMKKVASFRSFNLALGDKEGKLHIHRSEFSDSSSPLKMTKLHKEAFPFSSGYALETADVKTLDNIAQELDLEDNIILKIDVQGYEDRVIRGSISILSRIKVIIVETSFHVLYEGQPLFSDIYELLREHGFVYSGSWGELKSPLDGAPLQQDSIFIRK